MPMKVAFGKKTLNFLLLILTGVLINRLFHTASTALGIPMYLDAIGTMFVAALGGICPGMFVGYLTNVLGGLSDSTTFYYGTINVLIALIAGLEADRGYFDKLYRVYVYLPFYLLLTIPSSFLSFILFECQIADNVAMPATMFFYNRGIPIFLSQFLGNLCVEIPDKVISLTVAFFLVKMVPLKIRQQMIDILGRDNIGRNKEYKEKRSSLKTQWTLLLTVGGICIVIFAFVIPYKTYMETIMAEPFADDYDIRMLRREAILYSGKMVSIVLGLIFCVVSLIIRLSNQLIVKPLLKMEKELRRFAYDSAVGRDKSVAKIEALDIHTGNEIEELYLAIVKTVKEIDEYIDKTNEQSKTIADLHINIITTLADIVESRDETTGNHVKRTAEYAAILAKELRAEGKYTESLTDEYIEILKIAAPLHDIGKVKIPDAILNKPGKLTDEEYEIIKRHTTIGGTMLDNAENTMGSTEYLKMAKNIAMYHHEWWDGGKRGYPTGISGEEIPLSARIMAVADVLDALLSKRPYKKEYSLDDVFAIMQKESGTHFDPAIIEAMLHSKENICKIMAMYSE